MPTTWWRHAIYHLSDVKSGKRFKMTTNSFLFFWSKKTWKMWSQGLQVTLLRVSVTPVWESCQKKVFIVRKRLSLHGYVSLGRTSVTQVVNNQVEGQWLNPWHVHSACCGVLWQHIKPQITSHDNNPQHTDKSTKEDLRGRKGRVIVPVKVTLVTCRKTLKHLSTDGHEGRGVKNLQPNVKHQWKKFIIPAKVDNTSFCGWGRNYFFTQMNDVAKHATFICSHCIKDQRFAHQKEMPGFQRMYYVLFTQLNINGKQLQLGILIPHIRKILSLK